MQRHRFVDLDLGCRVGQRGECTGERPRLGYGEVGEQGVAVGPVLEEHEVVRILDVAVYRVHQAARLLP